MDVPYAFNVIIPLAPVDMAIAKASEGKRCPQKFEKEQRGSKYLPITLAPKKVGHVCCNEVGQP
jgi:hypothetical protein